MELSDCLVVDWDGAVDWARCLFHIPVCVADTDEAFAERDWAVVNVAGEGESKSTDGLGFVDS
jgi:hypothetical protein